MEWAEPIAYGQLKLAPREFEDLQPHEFIKLISGYAWRREHNENMAAYWVANLMNVQLRKPIMQKDLLQPLRAEKLRTQREEDEEALREEFAKLLKGAG
jgi:hypothetical protein